MDAVKKIDLDLERERRKWVDLLYPALALALHRYWGYGAKRIQNIINTAYDVADECAAYGVEKSMIQMLDEETGIELRSETDNRSYKETAFLSTNVKYKRLSRAQYICMRNSQIKWMKPSVLAGILLSLNRAYGFGYDRLVRLFGQMEDVIYECRSDTLIISDAAFNEVGFKFVER